MKISVCIPQHNRIAYLLVSLAEISRQTHPDVEICVVDDASTDDTLARLADFQRHSRYPIRFEGNPVNRGYDYTLRRALALATGEYCFTLGNDDTLQDPGCLTRLAAFLEKNQFPDIGFTNFVSDENPNAVQRRAIATGVSGRGPEVAGRYYASFAFVGGLVFRREALARVNTDAFDGSVFTQVGLALRIILAGGRLFTLEEAMVRKDLRLNGQRTNTWRDALHGDLRRFRRLDGGLPQLIAVVQRAFSEAGFYTPCRTYGLIRKHYRQTYPYWLLEYRSHGGWVNALGLTAGLFPARLLRRYRLGLVYSAGVLGWYAAATVLGLLLPTGLFQRVKTPLYNFIKRRRP